MAVQLFSRSGTKVFGEYNFQDMLDTGEWFLSEDELQESFKSGGKESDEEIRAKAKELGISSWHNKGIERLKKEIENVNA